MFWAWSSGTLYYISHTDEPSDAITVPGMPTMHKTHIRQIPFHHPDAPPAPSPSTPTTDTDETSPSEKTNTNKPIPDKEWLITLIREDKWKEYPTWESWSQPFHGFGKLAVEYGWYVLLMWGKAPTWVTMVGISMGGRWLS